MTHDTHTSCLLCSRALYDSESLLNRNSFWSTNGRENSSPILRQTRCGQLYIFEEKCFFLQFWILMKNYISNLNRAVQFLESQLEKFLLDFEETSERNGESFSAVDCWPVRASFWLPIGPHLSCSAAWSHTWIVICVIIFLYRCTRAFLYLCTSCILLLSLNLAVIGGSLGCSSLIGRFQRLRWLRCLAREIWPPSIFHLLPQCCVCVFFFSLKYYLHLCVDGNFDFSIISIKDISDLKGGGSFFYTFSLYFIYILFKLDVTRFFVLCFLGRPCVCVFVHSSICVLLRSLVFHYSSFSATEPPSLPFKKTGGGQRWNLSIPSVPAGV